MPTPTKRKVENIYPLTPMQEGMLFHALLDPGSTAYFEQLSWRVRGDLDVADFEASWNTLIERHAILRSLFVHEGTDRPLQVVLEDRPIAVRQVDLRGDDTEAAVEAFRAADRARPFDLSQDPLLRVAVLRLDDAQFEIVWSHHHVVLDGWSVGLAIAEVLDVYRARRAAVPPSLPPVTPFALFVKWLETRDQDAAIRFWTARISDCAEGVTLPHTREGSARGDAQRRAVSFAIGEAETAQLHTLASKSDVTLAVVLQAIWALLLGRYTDATDVVFGSVVSGRPPEIQGVERVIGNFINTVPVRVHLDQALTFDDLLAQIQRDAAEASPYQHVALSRVQSQHRLEDGLFGTLVSFANYPVDPRLTGVDVSASLGVVVETVTHVEQTHYDLDLQFVPANDLQVRIGYAVRFYDAAQIAAIEGHFRAVVAAVIASSRIRLDEIDPLSAAEHAALQGAVMPEPDWTLDDTVGAAFERQAAQTPERTAVRAAGGELTYAQLSRDAGQLARRLRAAVPVEADTTIGVMVERGTELAVALLGVLEAGAAYVPLEPSLPRDRVAAILASAGCKAVVASPSTAAAVYAATQVPVVEVHGAWTGIAADAPPVVQAADLAYVIYTSGSTGEPKGVMVEHRSIINLVHGLRTRIYDRHGDEPLRVALLASYSFDASVQQIFAALLLGHTLVIVDEATKHDGTALNRFLADHEVDVIDGTPTLLAIMARSAGFGAVQGRVRDALIGGEPLPWALADAVCRPDGMLVSNVYGPTECCVDATAQSVIDTTTREGPAVPVGHPLPGVQVLVVGRTGHLAPRGARGEICIAGAGVGRGYLNDEALTATKFVRLPLLGGLRVYRTSDLGRILPDGAVECCGRLDDQVKVRGFRIELGEIEHQLSTHPIVEQAAVFVSRTLEGDELRATLVLSAPVHADALRAHLGERLPEHMIPSRFYEAAALPRAPSGKLDRKRLVAGDPGVALEVGSAYAAPSNDIERALAQIWQSVLDVPRVGIDDNYFSLGGDSIKAIGVLSRLLRQGLRMEIRDLFRHRTIRSLAPFVEAVAPGGRADGGSRSTGPRVPSAAQAKFFAEHSVEPGRFHHAVLFDAAERLEPRTVGRAFALVRDRHCGLRFAFNPEPRVTPAGASDPQVPVVADLTAALPELLAPFDLASGPLHRLAIVRSEARDRLLIVVHHLCIDGVSWRILVEELGAALATLSAGKLPQLPALTDSALDVARKMADYARCADARGQLAYWRDVESRGAPLLVAQSDAPRAIYRDRASVFRDLDALASEAVLVDANHAYSTSPEDLLLTALARAIHARFDAVGIGVLLESHGRHPVLPDVDASRTIGWLTCLYPFVLSLDPKRDLGFQLKSMKEAVRAVPDHGVAYGLLRYLGGAPLRLRPQVSFNYLGQLDGAGAVAPLRMSLETVDGNVSPDAETLAELEVSAFALGGRLRLMLAFDSTRFERPTMDALLEAWHQEVLAIAEHCQQQAQPELTPSDLSYSGLSVDELDEIFR